MTRTNFENGMNAFPDADYRGMTLRDYFAAKALQGLISTEGAGSAERYAEIAYKLADAMLKARDD